MCGYRMSRPYRAGFFRCTVTDRENEVNSRSIRFCKLLPRLATESLRRDMSRIELFQCFLSHYPRRMAPCAVSNESRSALRVHNAFRHYRTSGIARTKKEHVVVSFRHWQQAGVQHDLSWGLTARTNALINLPSTCGAMASTSMFWSARNCRASSIR